MSPGRPRIFESPEQMSQLIVQYFTDEQERATQAGTPPQDLRLTMAGLCNALGIPRQTLHEYEKRDGFSDLIKAARQRVEECVEATLLYGKNQTGAIFWLKNHGGYKDVQGLEHTGESGGPIEWTVLPVASDTGSREALTHTDDT